MIKASGGNLVLPVHPRNLALFWDLVDRGWIIYDPVTGLGRFA